MDDLISVIVPIYNVERFLNRCISSIINQTYKNLEIILINDGSVDSSGSICDKYKKIDSRVKVVHQCNHGLSSARNKGIDLSCGKYICFVDGDDSIESKFIETLYNLIKLNNADISAVTSSLVTENGEFIKRDRVLKDEILEKDDIFDATRFDFFVCNKMYLKERVSKLRFTPKSEPCEDAIFTQSLLPFINKIVCSSLSLYNYTNRVNSILHIFCDINSIYAFVKTRYDFLIYVIKHKKNKNVIAGDAYLYLLHLNSLVQQNDFFKFKFSREIYKNFKKIRFKIMCCFDKRDFVLILKIIYHYYRNKLMS